MTKIFNNYLCTSSGIISYTIDGVEQPTSGADHFYYTDNDDLDFDASDYGIGIYTEPYGRLPDGRSEQISEFTAPEIKIKNAYNTGYFITNANTILYGDYFKVLQNTYETAYFTINGNASFLTSIENSAEININNGVADFNSATWATYTGDVNFTGTSSLKITSSSNGKTLIKAGTVTGTITLDVAQDVQDGNNFSIEATTNSLIITNREWVATPSTVGNMTTYTLSKAGPSIKQRLFYTYENGNKVLRFLMSGGIS